MMRGSAQRQKKKLNLSYLITLITVGENNIEWKKNTLTKQEIFAIIDKEIEKIESLPPATWGFTRYDIIEAIENIKDNIEELKNE